MVIRVVILLLLFLDLKAQNFNAAPYLAMGNTGIAQSSLFSVVSNPAGMTGLSTVQVGLACQTHFLSTDIQSQALFMGLPLRRFGSIGVSVNSYGIPTVANTLTSRVAYARQWGHSFSSSVSVNHHRYYVRNYESSNTWSLDLGFQYLVAEQIRIGWFARNVTGSFYEDHVMEYIPKQVAAGILYELSRQLSLSGDIYYDWLAHWNYRGGFAYQFDKRLSIKGGACSGPLHYTAGFGLLLAKLQIDVASSFHPRLGTSPQLAMSYGF